MSAPIMMARKQQIEVQPGILYQIKQGSARTLGVDPWGQIITLGFWSTSDVLGQSFTSETTYTIESLTHLEIEILSDQQGKEAALLFQAQQLEALLVILNQRFVRQRLYLLLQYLDRKFGCWVEAGRLINLPLSHRLIAETIGTTRSTVSRLCCDLTQQGILTYQKHRLILQCSLPK
jgi:CRP-like cAMP-binding protein